MATRDRRPALIAALFLLMFIGGLAAWPTARTALCPSILVASSSEKAGFMSTLAGDYSASHKNTWAGCGPVVRVEQIASGDAEDALAHGWPDTATRPDVWAPAAATWVDLLNQAILGTRFAGELPPPPWDSIATSPLVVAMPQVMAKALGWPNVQLSWSALLELVSNSNGWASKGHPEFGPFRLGKTDPTKSTSGMHTLIAEFYAAEHDPGVLTPDGVEQPSIRSLLARVEASVSHYAPTAGEFLANLSRADNPAAYISAVPVEEQEVFSYNEGIYSSDGLAPRESLDEVYPSDGTLYADHPYVVLSGAWVNESKRQIAQAFEAWLRKPEQQARFAAIGFRDYQHNAGPDLANEPGIIPSPPTDVLPTPSGAVLQAIVQSWATLRRPARILIVLAVDTAAERDAVKRALRDNLGPADEVGLMVPPGVLVVGATGVVDTVENDIATAPLARGPTALYATIQTAYEELSGSADASSTNAVVVIASVPNAGTSPTSSSLERELRNTKATVPVRIYAVALGGADRVALTAIERASGAYVSPLRDPSSAIRSCVANF